MRLFRRKNARIKESWVFFAAFFVAIVIAAITCQLIGFLGFAGRLSTVSKLICVGAGIHTAIAMEALDAVLNSRSLNPITEVEFSKVKIQLLLGFICGIFDVLSWIVNYAVILPHLEGWVVVGLIFVFVGFFLPPYVLPPISLCLLNRICGQAWLHH